ncbi:MAG: DUF3857 and transglutaminase domain-containing protein [Acidobacteriaceae bacterium]
MTSDPAAPGAGAVFLSLDVSANDRFQEHIVYARIKILSQKGIEEFSDIAIPYLEINEGIRGVEGRTIHSDGTIVPFTGKPFQKELVKAGGVRVMEKAFSMPDVQVGSILEYRYTLSYEGVNPPKWYVQEPVFVHHAHYHFLPAEGGQLLATSYLPDGAQVADQHAMGWDLVLNNIPPQVEEDDAPPLRSLGYHVLFYYQPGEDVHTPEQYWQQAGLGWSSEVDQFLAPGKLRGVVAGIVAPGDTDEQKLRKIYAAVMTLENTSFTREHTDAENKANKLKTGKAIDIWNAKRGDADEIALLFVAMARAAGMKAYAMMVTDRDKNVFLEGEADWRQLDDAIAIVNVGGKEEYFDPGERYCEFGELAWKHTMTTGVRQMEKGVELANTPPPSFSDTKTVRHADLTMDAQGQTQGTVRMAMTGAAALKWRQEALQTDAEQTQKEFSDAVRGELPEGMTVTMKGFGALTDSTQPLTATLDVSGPMGTRTGKRLLLPGTFFEAQAKGRYSSATRENPVYLQYSYSIQDHVTLHLPDGAKVELLPKSQVIPFLPYARFAGTYGVDGASYEYGRAEEVGGIAYETKQYPALRNFFQSMNTQDQARLVLAIAPAAGGATTAKSK